MQGILDSFPVTQHAIAYGSGVFKQPGLYGADLTSKGNPMIDLVFAVDDPFDWHQQNLRRNRRHYSWYGSLGPAAISWVGEHVGAGVYYNTFVPWGRGMIKYGVISLATLCRDLLTWDALYIAGRLQKPVITLKSHAAVEAAQEANLESAVRSALLTLPERFTLRQMLRTLCGLSYTGDFRMSVAEDSRKIERIVDGSFQQLVELYTPPFHVAENRWGVLRRDGDWWTQDTSPMAKAELLAALPATVLTSLAAGIGRPVPQVGLFDPSVRAKTAVQLAEYSKCQELLGKSLAATVRRSSWRQAAVGLFSAGLIKASKYACRKLQKASRSVT